MSVSVVSVVVGRLDWLASSFLNSYSSSEASRVTGQVTFIAPNQNKKLK